MKYANQFFYQLCGKDSSLWIIIIIFFLHNFSVISDNSLITLYFLPKGSSCLLYKQGPDRLYNKLALAIKNIFLALGTTSKTTPDEKKVSLPYGSVKKYEFLNLLYMWKQ